MKYPIPEGMLMKKELYDEMVENINKIDKEMCLAKKKVFLFGHCNTTLEMIEYLDSQGIKVTAILDNNDAKQGLEYKNATVVYPGQIIEMAGDDPNRNSVVLITSRFYAAMLQQLREIGYEGTVRKIIDYNTYAEYSLSDETIVKMKKRVQYGGELLGELSEEYENYFKVFCPFNALGDIYFMISYWAAFAEKRKIEKVVFCVSSQALDDVIHMFGDYQVRVYEQREMDAMIQFAIYTQDENVFIAHQDRPYVVNLAKALYIKKISLEQIYCCGVYGLPVGTSPSKPIENKWVYKDINSIPEKKTVIFSPYAKSVISIDSKVWSQAVTYYSGAGYKCYTNVIDDEQPLEGTEAISPSLLELRSVVERAGIFVGIRSGLCDILREAKAKKIALYPDYNYCDTRWKAIDMYYIEQFEYNLLEKETIEWEKL